MAVVAVSRLVFGVRLRGRITVAVLLSLGPATRGGGVLTGSVSMPSGGALVGVCSGGRGPRGAIVVVAAFSIRWVPSTFSEVFFVDTWVVLPAT